ncbi:MAG: DUF3857 domain-containing transglutaminase family protein [Opitutaceae bacterium]|jgi:hypothetical protein
MIRLRLLLVSLVLFPNLFASAHAASRAFIVVGLAAGETQASRLEAHAKTLREGFIARGLSADAVTVMGASGERLRRDAILAALKPAAGPVAANDETWLVLLGSASARNGEPSFQISGPRLTAADLATAVKALSGHKFVVVATTASGGFLPPLLALPEVDAVAATADSGEINEPRFAEAWAEALVATPQAAFADLAASAAKRIETFYKSASLAQGEHARLIDRAAGKIIEAPFTPVAGSVSDPTPRATPASPTPGFSVADIEIPKPADDTDIERRPATDETRALVAEARAAAKDDAHAAIFLRKDIAITVGRDFSVIERHRTRAYLRTGESLDELGTLILPTNPPDFSTRLEGVRVITPDGSQVLVNPRAYDERRAEDTQEADDARAKGRKDAPVAPPFLPLPEVTAGCIIEAGWIVEHRSSASMPEFSDEWFLAEHYPVRALHLSVTTPTDARWRVFAPNLPAAKSEGRAGPLGPPRTTNDTPSPEPPSTRTYTWTLADLPAFEPRPGDAPAKTTAPWVGVSSLVSWDAFAAWYQRIAAGSDTTGPAVAALAEEIAKAHPDRTGRLRAAYERVAALRYVAVELGVGAFRPRTPEKVWKQRYGDCKDKANLLVAVLGKLGIPAEFVLVNRFDHTFTDWPAWQFNHALVRIPASPADEQPWNLWLDTTDRLVPFGIVAPGDLGRHALAFSRDFSKAAFHEITAAQEPQSEWHEDYHFDDKTSTWTLRLSAKGSAEVTLRRMFVNMPAGVRAEHIQSVLSWREAGFVQQVATNDPYDAGTPFIATIQLNNSADAMSQNPPHWLVPGLEFFRARILQRSQSLWWDEGRTWTISRGQEDTSMSHEIPGHVPAPKPGEGSLPFYVP